MKYEERLMASNERIVFTTRQHWIVLAYHAVINLVPALILAVVVLILSVLVLFPPLMFALVLLALPLGRFIVVLLQWWNEQYMITNRRVIQTRGMITKHVIDSSLEKVNDVVLTQSVWGRLLNYGDVEILTASEIGVNRLRRMSDPVGFKTAMMDQRASLGTMEQVEDASAARPAGAADIPQIIAQLEELRKQGIISQDEFEQKKKALLDKI
jgi:uncharacterized membrane protein YdbT with pleckstrin-like domain